MTRSTTTKTTRTASKPASKPAAGKSKSDIARGLLKSGKTVNQVVAAMSKMGKPMGYPFVYGVAKRSGLHTTAANRRPNAGSQFTKFAEWMGIGHDRAVILGVAFTHGQPFSPEVKKTPRKITAKVITPVVEATAE